MLLKMVFALLLLLLSCTDGSTCSSSSTLAPITYKLNKFFGITAQAYKVVQGTSGSLYYSYGIGGPPSNTAIRKMNSDDTLAWMTCISSSQPILKSLAIDPQEQNIYYAFSVISKTTVVRLETNTGGFVDSYEHSAIRGMEASVKVFVLSDNSGYYIMGPSSATYSLKICKYQFDPSFNSYCQEISFIYGFGYGQLSFADGHFFALGNSDSNGLHLYFTKFAFGNTSVDWRSKMDCLAAPCTAKLSESLLSSDSSKIHSLFTHGTLSNEYLYYVELNATTGSVSGSRYQSNIVCSSVYGSARNGDNIVATVSSSQYYIIVYNVVTSVFKFYSFSGFIYGCSVDSRSGRFIVSGYLSGNCYISKFKVESLSVHPSFTFSTMISMNIILPGTSDIQPESPSLLTSVSPFAVSQISQSLLTFTYIPGSTYSSDVNYLTNDQSFSIIEGYTDKMTPELPCSSSGTTSIVYSISSYLGATPPTWTSINSSTGQLTLIAPDVNSDTNFYFYIDSSIVGTTNPVQKLMKIKVANCAVKNCATCSSSSVNICIQCKSGYSLESDSCVPPKVSTSPVNESKNSPSDLSESMKLVSQCVLASSISVVVGVSLLNSSSISSLWSMINQIQLLYLLLLTGVYIPIDVKIVITGMETALNMPQLISFQKIGIYSSFLDLFNFELSSTDYDVLNIETKSTIYNLSPSFVLLILITILHLFVYFLHKLFLRYFSERRWLCLIPKWIVSKAFVILTFGWYIRYALEMNQYILVSSIFEIYKFEISQSLKIISLVFAIITVLLCLFLIAFVSYLTLSEYEVCSDSHNRLGEFFNGIKMQKKKKVYVLILLLRRSIFVLFLITLASVRSWMVIGVLTILQLCYTIFIIIQRPFEETKCNIIEIVNELYFFILFGSLIHLNSIEKWSFIITRVYIWVIVSNNMVAFLIVFGMLLLLISIADMFRSIIIKVKSKCSKPQHTEIRVIPSASSFISYMRNHRDLPQNSRSETDNKTTQNEGMARERRYTAEESKIVLEDRIIHQQFAKKDWS